MVAGAATIGGTVGAGLAGSATGLFAAIYGGPAAGILAFGGAATLGILTGGVGLAIIGADGTTWDCWKPILHDISTTPSSGRTLKDVVENPLVTNLSVYDNHMIVRNIWGENFRLDPVILQSGNMALHASIM